MPRGGKREGAGPPHKYGEDRETMLVSIRMPVDLVEWLDKQADKAGTSRSEWITRRIEQTAKGAKR